MKKKIFAVLCFAFFAVSLPARADLFGGDLPLLSQIVLNTLHTLYEMQRQTSLLKDQMSGIKERIERIRTISELVQPSTWKEWKDPGEALRRLQEIYFTLPKEYRSEKSDTVEAELSRAMVEISKISGEAHTTFLSGKELEMRGAEASPGVAQKLTASGMGSMVAMAAQSQVLESHITSLLAQMLAESSEKESRALVSVGAGLKTLSESLSQDQYSFSSRATAIGGAR